MSTYLEAVEKGIEEYWDKLRMYALPYGKSGGDMFSAIEHLVKRDAHLIADVVEHELNKDTVDVEIMSPPSTRMKCPICGRKLDSINYESHMGVMHTPVKPVEDPENGWWDGDWSSLETAVRTVVRDEVNKMLFEDQEAALKKMILGDDHFEYDVEKNSYSVWRNVDEEPKTVDPQDPEYRQKAILFNDITSAPGRHLLFSQRNDLARHLHALGWRREERSEDVTG